MVVSPPSVPTVSSVVDGENVGRRTQLPCRFSKLPTAPILPLFASEAVGGEFLPLMLLVVVFVFVVVDELVLIPSEGLLLPLGAFPLAALFVFCDEPTVLALSEEELIVAVDGSFVKSDTVFDVTYSNGEKELGGFFGASTPDRFFVVV